MEGSMKKEGFTSMNQTLALNGPESKVHFKSSVNSDKYSAGVCEWQVTYENAAIKLRPVIKNTGKLNLKLNSIDLVCLKEDIDLDAPPETYRILLRSRSFEYAGTCPLFNTKRSFGDLNEEIKTGWHFTVIQSSQSQKCLLMGLGHKVRFPAKIQVMNEGLSFSVVPGVVLRPGEIFRGDVIYVIFGKSSEQALKTYVLVYPRQAEICDKNPVAWNSWDYFLENVHQEDVWANINFIQQDVILRRHISHIVVDMGWSRNQGDWVPNDKFSEGMGAMAGRIINAGFTPGLWFAPFWVDRYSDIAVTHPEYLVKDTSGAVKAVDSAHTIFTLDPSHPHVKRHLYVVFQKYRKMGYKYFKIDFLADLLKQSCFSNAKINGTQAIRLGVEVIRDAIGHDSFLLASTAPMESVTGFVDGFRVTHDIAPFWSVITSKVRMDAMSAWMNRRLWINDPDFLIVRGPKTSREKKVYCFRNLSVFAPFQPYKAFSSSRLGQPITTEGEVRVIAAAVLLSGGLITLSDHLPKLNKLGLRLLYNVLENRCSETASPLGLFLKSYPDVWVQSAGNYLHIGVINLHDRPRCIHIFDRDLKLINCVAHGPVRELLGCKTTNKDKWGPNFQVMIPGRDAAIFKVLARR